MYELSDDFFAYAALTSNENFRIGLTGVIDFFLNEPGRVTRPNEVNWFRHVGVRW
jgi:hypothetical protein